MVTDGPFVEAKESVGSYAVVEVKNEQITYKVVEPGHLYAEKGMAKTSSEHLVWLVNSSDLPLPVRRVETSVPVSFGKCTDLAAETRLTKWDGTPVPVAVTVANCTTAGKRHNLTIAATANVPRRSSVPIYVHKK